MKIKSQKVKKSVLKALKLKKKIGSLPFAADEDDKLKTAEINAQFADDNSQNEETDSDNESLNSDQEVN
jgi:hypothetical protein